MKIYASGKSTLLAVLLLCVAVVVQAQRVCRMDPDVEQDQCSLPYQLGNFQGYYLCDPSVLVGRPETIRDMRDIVASFEFVQAVGVGHSWWQEQFCSGDDENAVNLVMTELKSTLDFIENPVNPSTFNGQEPPEDFPIKVDEDKQEVTVAAGIPQRALLEYLSEYTYGKEPNGWTLPAFSWFIDQTIGGAVATGTHGSSLQHGSLSSQLTSLRLMLANGTIIDISPEDNPHLFKAAGVSIGRLGVITDITLKIKPQQAVTRNLRDIEIEELANEVKKVQDEYNAAIAAGDDEAAKLALAKLDETQALWHVASKAVWRTDYTYLELS
jgi:FAD/FMN-containing dehydrogenase